MNSIGKSKGFNYLVAPVRPNEKSKYPLTSIDDYITWKSHEGLPFDAWLRVHVRAGAKIIRPCHEAMTIHGTRAEWEEWTEMKLPQSGKYIIPGALNPISIDIQRDEGFMSNRMFGYNIPSYNIENHQFRPLMIGCDQFIINM